MDLARLWKWGKLEKSMSSKTPFFQAFGPLLFGRRARATLTKLKRLNSLQELYELVVYPPPPKVGDRFVVVCLSTRPLRHVQRGSSQIEGGTLPMAERLQRQ